ncbi:FtsB family cell division protein [Psychroflexus sp. ALD_RP9]|uniref:FtsB family cell division protein n=1 Tax=Psychroflexus sp. ALD_RP9 TaxID=2777186 RepID=UPI001A8F998A|nr:septum formation initiator family protein [Psychroflexus sp. ALD_RP9]QSS96716.1 septum formation initiator family protein [Psychroflexus sp. ALD_RP9]
MKLNELRHKRWFKLLTNKYILTLSLFIIWMLFIDTNSWLIHHELNQDIEELKQNKQYYINEIAKDKATFKTLNDSVEIERFARENYFMKRPNEEVYIIEYEDSLQQN